MSRMAVGTGVGVRVCSGVGVGFWVGVGVGGIDKVGDGIRVSGGLVIAGDAVSGAGIAVA